MRVALEHPGTRAEMRRRWRRALGVTAVAAALLVPVAAIGPEDWGPAPYALIVGVPLLALGLFLIGAAALIRRPLRRYAWQPVTARYRFVPDRAAVLDAVTATGERLVLRVYTPSPARQRALRDTDAVWVAVGAAGFGAVAPPEGKPVGLAVRPPVGSRRARHLERVVSGR